jgi:hypothetical protein
MGLPGRRAGAAAELHPPLYRVVRSVNRPRTRWRPERLGDRRR